MTHVRSHRRAAWIRLVVHDDAMMTLRQSVGEALGEAAVVVAVVVAAAIAAAIDPSAIPRPSLRRQ